MKCDEKKPACSACLKSKRECVYVSARVSRSFLCLSLCLMFEVFGLLDLSSMLQHRSTKGSCDYTPRRLANGRIRHLNGARPLQV